MKDILIIPGVLLLFALPACSQSGVEITEKQYRGKWPFTVSSGQLQCVKGAVIFHAKGKDYAVNDIAAKKGYVQIDEIRKEDHALFEMAKEIAKAEKKPVFELIKSMNLPTRISLEPILKRGLTLCK